jgi:hypothetical protein
VGAAVVVDCGAAVGAVAAPPHAASANTLVKAATQILFMAVSFLDLGGALRREHPRVLYG